MNNLSKYMDNNFKAKLTETNIADGVRVLCVFETAVSIPEDHTRYVEHEAMIRWYNLDREVAEITGQEFILLATPPQGYHYQLQENYTKKCARCGKHTDMYVIAPYGSAWDGTPICAECLDK